MDKRVPMRWPAAWLDAAALELLKSTPVNCLIAGSRAGMLREAAAAAGIAAFDNPPADATVVDGAWPGIRLSREAKAERDKAESGPTGAPWIDSNGWKVRLEQARADKPVWVAFDPPKGSKTVDGPGYLLAVSDVAAAGGRWILSLDDAFAAALAAREPAAVEQWRKLGAAMTFFEKHRAWVEWPAVASLGVVSDFAGGNEFMATEILNLAARRNLLYRVVDKTRADRVDLAGLRTVVYPDKDPLSTPVFERLSAFAAGGGLVIATAPVAARFQGKPDPSAPDGYAMRAVGKGRVAWPAKEWDDPFLLAADAHILMSRRYDPLRVYNAASVYAHFTGQGAAGAVQLVNYSRRGAAGGVAVGLARPYARARFLAPGVQETMLKPVRAERGIELRLPPFALYAALELEGGR